MNTPINILIVDDEPKNLTVLETVLDDPAYRLVRAESADQALLALVREEFALLILDIRMPGMTGFELAQTIKERKKTASVPIIFLTAFYNEDQHILEGYVAGAVDYLLKPVNPAILRSKVAVFAELYRKSSEAATANRALLFEVTERRRAEEQLREINGTLERRVSERTVALRESEERLRVIYDGTNEYMSLLMPEGTLLEANRAALEFAGSRREDVVGLPIWETVWFQHTPGMPEAIRRAVVRAAAGEVVRFEAPIITPLGETKTLDVSFRPIRDNEGDVVHIVTVGLDVTDRKQIEQALKDADNRKDEFLATLAHELRNPLAPISTGLQLIKLDAAKSPTVATTCEMMERQLRHMVRLIDDLLDVARISRGQIKLKRVSVQLRTVIEHAVEITSPMFEEAGHELIIRVVDKAVWLDGDHTRLTQVVSNMLNNAAKYTPAGGRIVISGDVEADQVVIRVTDNGIGLSAEILPRVFDLFTQVSRTLDCARGGLGIGLSLVKKLLEMHGGTIEAESPGLGLGSTFTVRLPTVSPPAPCCTPVSSRQRAAHSHAPTPLRILVVDDSADGARSLATLLKTWGHQARVAHDGPEAIEVASSFRPELVFLDIGLPGIDGCEVCRRLQTESGLSGTTFVALTGRGTEEDKTRSRDAGFAYHLVKPCDPVQLEALLEKASDGGEQAVITPGE